MPLAQILKMTFRLRDDATGETYQTGYHVRRNPTAGGIDLTFLNALLGDANTTSLKNAFKGMMPTTQAIDAITLREIVDPQNPNDNNLEAARAVGEFGTRAGTQDGPHAASGLINLYSDSASRRGRGRMWPPPSLFKADLAGDAFSGGSGYVTALFAWLTEMQKTFQSSGGSHYGGNWNDVDAVIFSRRGRAVDATNYWFRIQRAVVDRRIHWLHSRVPRP